MPPNVRGRLWRSGKPQDDFQFDKISDYLIESDTLVWVDLCDPDHDVVCDLAEELSLNQWAVEDALADTDRVKATNYKTHTFFNVYGIRAVRHTGGGEPESMLSIRRISAFVLPQALITVRLSPAFDINDVTQRWEEIGAVAQGVGALLHGLLDVVVDSHFEAVEVLDDCLEGIIDEELFANKSRTGTLQRRIFHLRRELVNLRRVALPMRGVVNVIQHHRLEANTSPELDAVYSDLYDHVLRVSESTETLRDTVTTVFETHLSLQDARMNTVMKQLSAWAAIIAIPTAITGYYGQNVPYPGYGAWAGFVASSVSIVVLVVLLYVNFRSRDWL